MIALIASDFSFCYNSIDHSLLIHEVVEVYIVIYMDTNEHFVCCVSDLILVFVECGYKEVPF
jgi:hypothetical protein